MNSVLLDIKELKKSFVIKRSFAGSISLVKALSGVNLQIYRGETLGLVGESGCGKSTLGRLIMMIEKPTDGKIFFDGKDISSYSHNELNEYRKKVQIIFQDSYASLNPRMTAANIVVESLLIHKLIKRKEENIWAARLIKMVGLNIEQMKRYPHEFSGGQRQRIGIARAIALQPKLIVADEPVSALDVTVQAQILKLLKDIQIDFGLTYLFITHDLRVLRHMSDRIAVMYLGKIIELANNYDIYIEPLHPYTKALISAVPSPIFGNKKERIILEGDVASAIDPPDGCTFHTRCPFKNNICSTVEPTLECKNNGHLVACHLY